MCWQAVRDSSKSKPNVRINRTKARWDEVEGQAHGHNSITYQIYRALGADAKKPVQPRALYGPRLAMGRAHSFNTPYTAGSLCRRGNDTSEQPVSHGRRTGGLKSPFASRYVPRALF